MLGVNEKQLFWKKGQDKHLQKMIYRLERELLTRHPDKLLTMPQEVKDAIAKKAIPQRCIDKLVIKHEQMLRRNDVPHWERPPRLSHG